MKVTVNGACGRMGLELVAAMSGFPDMELACLWERAGHPGIGSVPGTATIPVTAQWAGAPGDVIVDFSTPEGLEGVLAGLSAPDLPALVTGTTGLPASTLKLLEEASRLVPILRSANMSVGIQLLHLLCAQAAKAAGDEWDVEIVEMHHSRKVDAPSGTAAALADTLMKAWPVPLEPLYGRSGACGPRGKKEIGVHAVRGGDVVGEHEVIFAGPGEVLRLQHTALSRSVFAAGALRAARWLSGRAPGMYGMEDVVRGRGRRGWGLGGVGV